jgi:hypothetical protein
MPRKHLLAVLTLAAALLAAPLAQSATSGPVVSQVYAGGGNAGATYANDYIELFNRTTTAVDLTGWSVQYASAASTSWQAVPLSGSLQPGRYYLVQLASAGAVGAALPAPDATGTLNLAASAGKVALGHDTAALTGGAAAGSCSSVSTLADLVGWGTAADYEGSAAAPALSNTTAELRAGNGCTETDSNAADFTAVTPAPRNGSSAALSCGGGSTGGGTGATITSAGVAVDVQALLSLALERPSISFGQVFPGQTPAPVSERLTVVSTDAAGYLVAVHRTAFAPADLPLGIAASSTQPLVAVPVAPTADLTLASSSAATTAAGDVVPAVVGFTAPLPALPPGRYTSTITFTVVGR